MGDPPAHERRSPAFLLIAMTLVDLEALSMINVKAQGVPKKSGSESPRA